MTKKNYSKSLLLWKYDELVSQRISTKKNSTDNIKAKEIN